MKRTSVNNNKLCANVVVTYKAAAVSAIKTLLLVCCLNHLLALFYVLQEVNGRKTEKVHKNEINEILDVP